MQVSSKHISLEYIWAQLNDPYYDSFSLDNLELTFNEMGNADFSQTNPWGDWKHHIPVTIRHIWHDLSRETQLVAYFMAMLEAHR